MSKNNNERVVLAYVLCSNDDVTAITYLLDIEKCEKELEGFDYNTMIDQIAWEHDPDYKAAFGVIMPEDEDPDDAAYCGRRCLKSGYADQLLSAMEQERVAKHEKAITGWVEWNEFQSMALNWILEQCAE